LLHDFHHAQPGLFLIAQFEFQGTRTGSVNLTTKSFATLFFEQPHSPSLASLASLTDPVAKNDESSTERRWYWQWVFWEKLRLGHFGGGLLGFLHVFFFGLLRDLVGSRCLGGIFPLPCGVLTWVMSLAG